MTRPTDPQDPAAIPQPPPLVVSRIFHARRPIVFRAWSTAEHVANWFSPRTYSVAEAKVEMRVGGPFEVCMLSPAGERHWTRGTFAEVTPHDRLVLDLHADDLEGNRLFRAYTEVTFTDVPGGTRMDVVQTYTFLDPRQAAPMVAGAAEGWRTTLDKLEAEVLHLAGITGAQPRSVVHASFDLRRHYPAPVERVWHALTDEAAKQKWFGGPPSEVELIERSMDVREGGRERAKGRWRSGMVSTFDATYHDVVPGKRLVYSYVMHLDDKKISVSLATMQLEPENGGTTLRVTEQGAFLDGYDDAGSREHGTGYLLDRLGQSLED